MNNQMWIWQKYCKYYIIRQKNCLSKIEDKDNLRTVTNVFFTSEAKLIESEVLRISSMVVRDHIIWKYKKVKNKLSSGAKISAHQVSASHPWI